MESRILEIKNKGFKNINVKNLIPHDGEMVLVDEVLDIGVDFIITQTKIKKDNAFLEQDRFPTYKSLEIMAQSLGIFRGLLENGGGNKLGFLLGARRFEIIKPFIDIGCKIQTKVQISLQDMQNGFGVYSCQVNCGDDLIATSSISVLNPNDNFLDSIKSN